ncbi:MAG: alanine--tRNA ligase [Ignavibacteria bacterium]|nr:alanine--tRNA ligase [Ignavibacteria bacterium]
MNSGEIRKSFLDFFAGKGHTIVPSSPVVPYDDPTLLFTNAGMNQFKDVFLGKGAREYSRAADTQKCIRAGGKHNDLEEVGMDGYHHTFFEMLGNWSFGDYYKKEAIEWAWDLLTNVWKLPKDRLWATVFETDDEAWEIWRNNTDIHHDHILRFGEKDNFWEMGDTGPCGPCSEIHIDLTVNGCRPEDVNSGHEEVIEIWNLVFIQYNRKKDGELDTLPRKHVDTGMGFERIVRVLQGRRSNYETDIFFPLIEKIVSITGKKYEGDNVSSMNAIADHSRALTFAIADGAVPSNEGRGYVLRRILRRASRLARKLDYSEPMIFQLSDTIAGLFGDVFPEVVQKNDFVKEIIMAEEENFHRTLDRGISLFTEVCDSLKDTKIFPGKEAFKLYDTFGFPLDLTEVMARERGLKVDVLRFDEEMEKQRNRAKSARKEHTAEVDLSFEKLSGTDQVLYNPYSATESGVRTEVLDSHASSSGGELVIAVRSNPFYSESGGQVSDTGEIITPDGGSLKVIASAKSYIVAEGTHQLKSGEMVTAKVDMNRRHAVERNHSATHLVHEALKRVLGNHVKQVGSLVSDEYLRFDFPHFHKLETAQIRDIEALVNSKIMESIPVQTLVDVPIEEANRIPNVKQLFGEKYGSKVRVVIIDENFSAEFCGGTHVNKSADIGLFKITREESIAAGTRRIFARTGAGILNHLNEKLAESERLLAELPEKYSAKYSAILPELRQKINTSNPYDLKLMMSLLNNQEQSAGEIAEAREKYLEEKKAVEKQLAAAKAREIGEEIDGLIARSPKAGSHSVVTGKVDAGNAGIKEISEEFRKRLKNGVGLLAAMGEGKFNLICAVSDELVKEKGLNAGKLVADAAKQLGGGGGGKPNLATAGARDADKLDPVLSEFSKTILQILS